MATFNENHGVWSHRQLTFLLDSFSNYQQIYHYNFASLTLYEENPPVIDGFSLKSNVEHVSMYWRDLGIPWSTATELVGPSKRLIVGGLSNLPWCIGSFIIEGSAFGIRNYFHLQLIPPIFVACTLPLIWLVSISNEKYQIQHNISTI